MRLFFCGFFCPLLLLLVRETKEREVRRDGTEDKVLQMRDGNGIENLHRRTENNSMWWSQVHQPELMVSKQRHNKTFQLF